MCLGKRSLVDLSLINCLSRNKTWRPIARLMTLLRRNNSHLQLRTINVLSRSHIISVKIGKNILHLSLLRARLIRHVRRLARRRVRTNLMIITNKNNSDLLRVISTNR